jgi:hypothetical protein
MSCRARLKDVLAEKLCLLVWSDGYGLQSAPVMLAAVAGRIDELLNSRTFECMSSGTPRVPRRL